MTYYSIKPRNQLFIKRYGFLSFFKNMSKNTGRNISKILNGKYSHKLLDHAKKSTTEALETAPKRAIQKNSRTNWSFGWK